MSKNPRKELFRDKNNGKLAGVCAGIAHYFGWETWLVRIIAISGVIFQFHFIIVLYIAGWLVLDKKKLPALNEANTVHEYDKNKAHNAAFSTKESGSIKVKTRIWQAGEPPKQALHEIHFKFKNLEKKLIKMEGYVTSSEFTLNREINRL